MPDELKVLANERDAPYQSPLKVYLAEASRPNAACGARSQRDAARVDTRGALDLCEEGKV
jgi:hypothetical protein